MRDDLQARIAALLPPIRAHLLAGVLAFTQAASRVSGVSRIALLGSLATDKPEPKDADLTLLAAHAASSRATLRAATAVARCS